MIFEKQILKMYKSMMHTRCDDNGLAFYFSADDFPGLKKEAYSFKASAGHNLQGYIYNYDDPISERLVVFDHGFGGGHRSYMKEIEKLCSHGYKVFAYDHTGCMESEGASPNGMAQSLCDLNDCITAIKNDPKFTGIDISVMGHSWGGFSTLNISSLHPEISHIVVLSGFVSVRELINTFFDGVMKGYRKVIMELENKSNPIFVGFDAVTSLSNSSTKALLIYSDNDTLCRKTHYDILKSGLENKDNISFILLNNKGHNPNYTEDAVKYLGEYGKIKAKKAKSLKTPEQRAEFISGFDWDRMTKQDDALWDKIFDHLDNK